MWDHIPLTLAQTNNKDVTKGDNTETKTETDGKAITKDSPGGQVIPQQQSPMNAMFIFILLGMFVLMIFFSMRTQKRERKRREAMLGGIKKGDRIQTIGGILGSVVEIREHKVVIKVDENNNTKMTFARTAIQTIFEDKSETEEADLAKTN